MYFIHNHDSYKTLSRKIKLNNFNFDNTHSLINFLKIIKKYDNKF